MKKTLLFLAAALIGVPAARAASDVACIAWHAAGDLNMPGNSRAAFSNAVARACEFVNLTIRTTKDGVPVISADASLKQTMYWDAKIAALTLKELRTKGTYVWQGEKTSYTIVTLGEALEIVKDLPAFCLDFKVFSPRIAEKVLSEFAARKIAKERIVCATGFYAALDYLAAKHPAVRRAAIVSCTRTHNGRYALSLTPGVQHKGKAALRDAILHYAQTKDLYGVVLPTAKGMTLPDDVTFFKQNGLWVALMPVQDPLTAALYADCAPDAFVTDHVSRVR